MDGFDIAAFVVMALLAAIAIGVFVFLGGWPGRVARANHHPYTEAISIGGWLFLIVGGVGWVVMMVWAYAIPQVSIETQSGPDNAVQDIESEVQS